MNLEIFSICDAATISGGKVNILGAFDTISVSDVPAVQHYSAIVIRIRSSEREETIHKFLLYMADEQGNNTGLKLEDDFNFPHSEGASNTTNFILNIQDIKFDKFGTYYLILEIDEKAIGRIPILIKKRK